MEALPAGRPTGDFLLPYLVDSRHLYRHSTGALYGESLRSIECLPRTGSGDCRREHFDAGCADQIRHCGNRDGRCLYRRWRCVQPGPPGPIHHLLGRWLELPLATPRHRQRFPRLAGPGTFTVTAQARCATDTQVLSAVSPGLTVVVTAGETISTPTTPSGPTAASTGTSYPYSTGGSTASSGNPVSYLSTGGMGRPPVGCPRGPPALPIPRRHPGRTP